MAMEHDCHPFAFFSHLWSTTVFVLIHLNSKWNDPFWCTSSGIDGKILCDPSFGNEMQDPKANSLVFHNWAKGVTISRWKLRLVDSLSRTHYCIKLHKSNKEEDSYH
jgi:hypothetical protein